MIEAIYYKNAYRVLLTNISGRRTTIPMKFDTGAVCSVISLGALSMGSYDIRGLAEALEYKASKRIFMSASGNQMVGYRICADNVNMSGYYLKHFYYYLVLGDIDTALLGDDFIQFCDFVHKKRENILIENFDQYSYEETSETSIQQSSLEAFLGEFKTA